jgi:hypothetical protein
MTVFVFIHDVPVEKQAAVVGSIVCSQLGYVSVGCHRKCHLKHSEFTHGFNGDSVHTSLCGLLVHVVTCTLQKLLCRVDVSCVQSLNGCLQGRVLC